MVVVIVRKSAGVEYNHSIPEIIQTTSIVQPVMLNSIVFLTFASAASSD
jgi:hypothetical protein